MLVQGLRIMTVCAAALVSVAIAHLAPSQHRPVPAAAHRAPAPVLELGVTLYAEGSGRVVIWERNRELAAEAAAQAPPPKRALPSYPPGSIQDIITRAFAPYGAVAVAWGLRVARCESGYNPRAYNPAGPYYGLFQFLMSTFKATPYGGGDIYDPVANANAAAWKYSRGGAGAWGCR